MVRRFAAIVFVLACCLVSGCASKVEGTNEPPNVCAPQLSGKWHVVDSAILRKPPSGTACDELEDHYEGDATADEPLKSWTEEGKDGPHVLAIETPTSAEACALHVSLTTAGSSATSEVSRSLRPSEDGSLTGSLTLTLRKPSGDVVCWVDFRTTATHP